MRRRGKGGSLWVLVQGCNIFCTSFSVVRHVSLEKAATKLIFIPSAHRLKGYFSWELTKYVCKRSFGIYSYSNL